MFKKKKSRSDFFAGYCTYGLIDNIFIFGNEFSSKNVNKKSFSEKRIWKDIMQ